MTDSKISENAEKSEDTMDFIKSECNEDEIAHKASCSTNDSVSGDNDPNSRRHRAISALEHQLNDFELTGLMIKAKSLESVSGCSIDGNPFDQYQASPSDDESDSLMDMAQPCPRQSLLCDLAQTQLALWTFMLSIAGTYWWQRRAHIKALVVAVLLFNASALLSILLLFAVVVAHIFRRDWASQMFASKWAASSLDDPNAAAATTTSITRNDSRRQSLRSQSSWISCYNNNRFNGGDSPTSPDAPVLDPFGSNCASTSDGTSASQVSGHSTPRSRASVVSVRSCCSATRVWQHKVQVGSVCYGRCLRA